MGTIKVGVVQSTPVFFDLEATMEKTRTLVMEQAAKGVELLLFPESFFPGYPRGFSFDTVVGARTAEGRQLWEAYWNNSVEAGDEYCQELAQLSREHNMYLIVGVTEKELASTTLYCSMFYFTPENGLCGVHRKLKPTGSERLIWGEGSGDGLITLDTPLARIGGLICWENLMPLARMSLYQQGLDLYLAPTADARPSWLPIMQHIAQESRCFVLSANQYFRRSDYPEEPWRKRAQVPEECCRGGSVIVSPYGEVLAGPLWDKEGVLIAEIDLAEVVRSRFDFSANGHYQRPDLFEFKLKT
ncbi:MAG: carbon-nitrogen hydrolase family protein [Bacteroidota bacterium]